MLRERCWALTAAALCVWTTGVQAQARLLPPVIDPAPENAVERPPTASAPGHTLYPLPQLTRSPAADSPSARKPVVSVSARLPDSAPLALTKANLGAPVAPTQLEVSHAEDACASGGVMAGASLYFLRPSINNNTAFVQATGIGTPQPVVAAENFDWSYRIAPAAWLGWTGPGGVGIRARYFHFDHDSEVMNTGLSAADAVSASITAPAGLSPLLGVPPRGFQAPGILLQDALGTDQLTFRSDLHIQTIDGEATYARRLGNLSLLAAAGGRYLQMHQNYRGVLINSLGSPTSELSILDAGRNFYGAGPTLGLQGTWRLGGSGFGFFGSARGSLLVGTSRQLAAFSEEITDPVNGNQSNLALNQSRDDVTLPILELESGLEWGRDLGRVHLFTRSTAVAHTYFDAGSPSSNDGNLSLFGVQMTIGVGY